MKRWMVGWRNDLNWVCCHFIVEANTEKEALEKTMNFSGKRRGSLYLFGEETDQYKTANVADYKVLR